MEMHSVIDQMGFEIRVPKRPLKIVSLVPSQTELLFDLGLDKEIKGVTKFCIHPKQKVADVVKVGGTKNFNFDRIKEINPDLIIGNKEENYEEGISQLKKYFPVWMSDITTLEDATDMVHKVGLLTGKSLEASHLVDTVKAEFANLKKHKPKRTLYFIWRKPFMVAGVDTFINEMLTQIGLINAIDEKRYPELSETDIEKLAPELILLSSEPYPFKAKHFEELSVLCPNADIRIVDGEMFSWYGSRLLKAPSYFNNLKF